MKVLYLSHTGMTEPLGQSQVLPYVRGLARLGWSMEVVCFEPSSATTAQLAQTRDELGQLGIGYHWHRRSSSHAIAVKASEAFWALRQILTRKQTRDVRILHARSYLPAAVADLCRVALPRAKFIFDCRGLLADEYADFGHWSRLSAKYRLLKQVERRLFGQADAVVVLTRRLKRWLREEVGYSPLPTPIEVIPCCVDLARFRFDEETRLESRRRIGAGDRFLLAYSGTLGSWYCEKEMARLFAAIRRRRPALFAVFSRSPTAVLREHLANEGIAASDVFMSPIDPADMPAALSGADAAATFIKPSFSKLASSPVKMAEYLALGLPQVLNRGIGDCDELMSQSTAFVDAGQLTEDDLQRSAQSLLALDRGRIRREARRLAEGAFDLEHGILSYHRLYQQLVS